MRRLALCTLLALGCDAPPQAARRCVAPDNLGHPTSISDAVALLNALPAPVDVACLLEALERPLFIDATRSLVSAQPAGGPQDPRIFIFVGDLVLSVVPAGPGQHLLEFGEQRGPTTSLKGELALPLDAPITASAPFAHLRYDAQTTTCGICHRAERPAEDAAHPDAYVSRSLRPLDAERVDLALLLEERATCDAQAEPTRCAILAALLDHGPVEARRAPAAWDTIFDQ